MSSESNLIHWNFLDLFLWCISHKSWFHYSIWRQYKSCLFLSLISYIFSYTYFCLRYQFLTVRNTHLYPIYVDWNARLKGSRMWVSFWVSGPSIPWISYSNYFYFTCASEFKIIFAPMFSPPYINFYVCVLKTCKYEFEFEVRQPRHFSFGNFEKKIIFVCSQGRNQCIFSSVALLEITYT